jgi:hypothetical protein
VFLSTTPLPHGQSAAYDKVNRLCLYWLRIARTTLARAIYAIAIGSRISSFFAPPSTSRDASFDCADGHAEPFLEITTNSKIRVAFRAHSADEFGTCRHQAHNTGVQVG